MTRPLKDRESNQPAKNISLTITEPRLEWLRNMAASRNYSMSGAVEFLIDQQRGSVTGSSSDAIQVTASLPGASFPLAARRTKRTKRVDPKADVDFGSRMKGGGK